MPGEVIDRPNPGPKPSHIPDEVLVLKTQDKRISLNDDDKKALIAFRDATNYIAVAMIFLRDNVLLERELKFEDVKPRLLGHFGTTFGLSLVYTHLNWLISKHNLDMIYVVGPGHGAPSILSALWLEGSLEKFYPQYSRDAKGLQNLITGFSTPAGFPSHISSETPGSIHEGGELGYCLSVAYGAVMDKPDLVVCCIMGDGESEAGPAATSWNGHRYIDPKVSGAVIPILHVNGFKISERTIPGTMDDKELVCLYTGYGYQVRFVEDLENIDEEMASAMEWALGEIKNIQGAARSGKLAIKPRWPMLVLRTPKGQGGPKIVDGEFIEGSFRSHQVPLMKAKSDPEQLRMLSEWLLKYSPKDILTGGKISELITRIIPKEETKRLGQVRETYDGYQPLDIPKWQKYAVDKGEQASCMSTIGLLLDQVLVNNPSTIRIFSPDELVSNKLDAVFEHTNRTFEPDEFCFGKGGRVIEMLSEHTLQGFAQGYTLTGRTALFPSYESFLGIVTTMVIQSSKFSKMAQETTWRKPIASQNFIETSTWTRQEHNGFSHQNPSFIGSVLNLKAAAARVYLPPDANTFLSTLAHCLASKNYVNLMVGSKQPSPVFLSAEEAEAHCRAGASIWKFASTNDGLNPDVVLAGIGCELTFEVIAAAAILRQRCPQLRVRVVNVTDLMILEAFGLHPHALSDEEFEALFTAHRQIHFNYHGYRAELGGLLFGRRNLNRVSIASYNEEGSTTTPFDMMLRNSVSRYHVIEHAVKAGAKVNEKVALELTDILAWTRQQVTKTQEFILKHGEDPEGIYDTPTFDGSGPIHRDVGYAD